MKPVSDAEGYDARAASRDHQHHLVLPGGLPAGPRGRLHGRTARIASAFPISLTGPASESTHRGPHRGSNSVVECNLAKVDVEGSNPFSRSALSEKNQPVRAKGSAGFFVQGPPKSSRGPLTRWPIRRRMRTLQGQVSWGLGWRARCDGRDPDRTFVLEQWLRTSGEVGRTLRPEPRALGAVSPRGERCEVERLGERETLREPPVERAPADERAVRVADVRRELRVAEERVRNAERVA